MSHQWYVVHTYSGFEAKAKQALEERIKALGKDGLFTEILVPSESVVVPESVMSVGPDRTVLLGGLMELTVGGAFPLNVMPKLIYELVRFTW